MKEFDLEKAKAGAPVCTRDGLKARIICWDLADKSYPIVAAVTNEDGVESVDTYTADGRFSIFNECHDYDLMTPSTKKREGWINIYKVGSGCKSIAGAGSIYPTLDAAKNAPRNTHDVIATVKIEWEE